jgi:hypothetical protein
MAGFGEIFGMGGEAEVPLDFRGNPLFGGDKGNPMGQGSSSINQAKEAGALAPTEEGGMSMAEVAGSIQVLAGLAGQFEAIKNQRSALKIKQTQNRINARFAKANFERKMTGLFQAHRDLEEQSMQQHTQREAAYQQKMGSMKVIQAERGMAGTSASETKGALTRSNLMAEQVMLGNLKKSQRSLMYQREGIADQRLAEELGFDMSNANIAAQLQTPAWVQAMQGMPDLVIDGMNTYYNFVRDSGR